MVSDVMKLEHAFKKISKLSKYLYIIFCLFSLLLAILFIISVYICMKSILNYGMYGVSDLVSVFTICLYLVSLITLSTTFMNIFKDITKNISPFTARHAKNIKRVSLVFIILFLLEAVLSPGFIAITASIFTFSSTTIPVLENPTITIDASAILAALLSFSLGSIWQYGVLLQHETEELF